MLRHARMAAMRKLRCGTETAVERPVWAVHVGRGEIVWQDRCDAANGSKEPMLQEFCFAANGGCLDAARNLQQALGLGTWFVAA